MLHKFYFKNFTADAALESLANQVLIRLITHSPKTAGGTAMLERLPHGEHLCRIEIYAEGGPYAARTQEKDAAHALQEAANSIHSQIMAWRNQKTS
jgi:hypothetical protein